MSRYGSLHPYLGFPNWCAPHACAWTGFVPVRCSPLRYRDACALSQEIRLYNTNLSGRVLRRQGPTSGLSWYYTDGELAATPKSPPPIRPCNDRLARIGRSASVVPGSPGLHRHEPSSVSNSETGTISRQDGLRLASPIFTPSAFVRDR